MFNNFLADRAFSRTRSSKNENNRRFGHLVENCFLAKWKIVYICCVVGAMLLSSDRKFSVSVSAEILVQNATENRNTKTLFSNKVSVDHCYWVSQKCLLFQSHKKTDFKHVLFQTNEQTKLSVSFKVFNL
jgi:hypothetical protein